MPRLKVFSGERLCRLLKDHGFEPVRQRGSHVVMQRNLGGSTTTVPVPLHEELRKGTLRAIIRQTGLPRELFEQ